MEQRTVRAELLDVFVTDHRTDAVERITAERHGVSLDTLVPLVFDGADGKASEVWSHVFEDPDRMAAFWGPPACG